MLIEVAVAEITEAADIASGEGTVTTPPSLFDQGMTTLAQLWDVLLLAFRSWSWSKTVHEPLIGLLNWVWDWAQWIVSYMATLL